jgi:hypothetical protein
MNILYCVYMGLAFICAPEGMCISLRKIYPAHILTVLHYFAGRSHQSARSSFVPAQMKFTGKNEFNARQRDDR